MNDDVLGGLKIPPPLSSLDVSWFRPKGLTFGAGANESPVYFHRKMEHQKGKLAGGGGNSKTWGGGLEFRQTSGERGNTIGGRRRAEELR